MPRCVRVNLIQWTSPSKGASVPVRERVVPSTGPELRTPQWDRLQDRHEVRVKRHALFPPGVADSQHLRGEGAQTDLPEVGGEASKNAPVLCIRE